MNCRLMILAFEAALIFVTPLQSEQHPDYTSNRYYDLGNRDGYHDFKKRQPKDHKRNFPRIEDRQAYEQGYEIGRLGGRTYRVDHPDSAWSRVRTNRDYPR